MFVSPRFFSQKIDFSLSEEERKTLIPYLFCAYCCLQDMVYEDKDIDYEVKVSFCTKIANAIGFFTLDVPKSKKNAIKSAILAGLLTFLKGPIQNFMEMAADVIKSYSDLVNRSAKEVFVDFFAQLKKIRINYQSQKSLELFHSLQFFDISVDEKKFKLTPEQVEQMLGSKPVSVEAKKETELGKNTIPIHWQSIFANMEKYDAEKLSRLTSVSGQVKSRLYIYAVFYLVIGLVIKTLIQRVEDEEVRNILNVAAPPLLLGFMVFFAFSYFEKLIVKSEEENLSNSIGSKKKIDQIFSDVFAISLVTNQTLPSVSKEIETETNSNSEIPTYLILAASEGYIKNNEKRSSLQSPVKPLKNSSVSISTLLPAKETTSWFEGHLTSDSHHLVPLEANYEAYILIDDASIEQTAKGNREDAIEALQKIVRKTPKFVDPKKSGMISFDQKDRFKTTLPVIIDTGNKLLIPAEVVGKIKHAAFPQRLSIVKVEADTRVRGGRAPLYIIVTGKIIDNKSHMPPKDFQPGALDLRPYNQLGNKNKEEIETSTFVFSKMK